MLPFKSALFSIVDETAGDVTVAIQPVSVVCAGLDGMPMTRAWRSFYSWYGDMTLVGHLWNVFSLGSFTVDVVFHPPVTSDMFSDRKALALACQKQVAAGVERCLKGRETGQGALQIAPPPSPTRLRVSHAPD